MKIALVSILTPASENIRGTSALPYHLMAGRDKDINITIYSFNFNELSHEKIKKVEKELGVTINVLNKPWWIIWFFKFRFLLLLRVLLKYPLHNYLRLPNDTVDRIKAEDYDGIWIYGEEMSRVSKQFASNKRIHTLPDCESLYYYRMLGRRMVTHSTSFYRRISLMYPKFLRMERNFDNSKEIFYHLVGKEDVQFLQENNPGINAIFIRHPHYNVRRKLSRNLHFHQPKIKLLIAGQSNIYMHNDVVCLTDELIQNNILLNSNYSITFLGKGWKKETDQLQKAGYEASHITFAPDYIEEICKYDIQITPISIGTGTKGKVLDALANGLLVIGTKYAMENIAVENGVSCIEYHQPHEVIECLKDIIKNIQKYEKIAAEGMQKVQELHNPAKIANELFSVINIT